LYLSRSFCILSHFSSGYTSDLGGSKMDRFANPKVRAATAEIPGERTVDILIARVLIRGKKHCGGHHLPRLAVPALHHLLFDPRLLHGMAAIFRKAFDCGDVFLTGA
jgi:hypothetical protein